METDDHAGPLERLNAALDTLPRTRFEQLGRERPAFRSCGIAGFYLALLVTLGAGPLAGRDPLALTAAAATCALSFFAYALGRKLVTGREELVLLEHVWVALAAATGALWGLGVPVRAHLDAVAAGLAFFLALGRCGCLLVGCCHGRPASIGIRYPAACARDGFPRRLVGVRLFPVQALEVIGLLALGLATTLVVLVGRPSAALGLFLTGYAVMRFGLEGLRGDRRPHLGGLSQSRWMALVELAAGLLLAEGRPLAAVVSAPRTVAVAIGLAALLLGALVRHGLRPDLLGQGHVRELRALVQRLVQAGPASATTPVSARTSAGVTVAISAATPAQLFISLAQAGDHRDLELLCALAARALPELEVASVGAGERVLFFTTPALSAEAPVAAGDLGDRLYGALLQPPAAAAPPAIDAGPHEARRTRYFGSNGHDDQPRPNR
jgi:hypothetical protein